MTLSLTQTATAVGANAPASFLATGGTAPYAYAILAGGAGGSIDSSSGAYRAPAQVRSDLSRAYDTIRVTDGAAATATSRILVGGPLLLFCEIIQKELSLADGRVYLWDQKISQPKDSGLYIAVANPRCKPFGNSNRFNPATNESEQFVAMQVTVDVIAISRGPEARDRNYEIILALNSIYAIQQQDANSFFIGKIPVGFMDESGQDGAAIPYRYRISVQLQYAATKAKPVLYFDDFRDAQVSTDP